MLVCDFGVTMLCRLQAAREMTLQVEIKTNYGHGVLAFGGFTGGSSEWGRDGCKRGWREAASDDVDDREGSELLEASVKISGPLGDQLSSITRRIQLQREAERIQHRSVTH